MYSKETVKALKLDFWKKLETHSRKLPYQRGLKKVWVGDRTGVKGIGLRFDVSKNEIAVALEINNKHEARRFQLYEKLEAAKVIFESAFGEPLIWDFAYTKEHGEEVCRAYVKMDADYLNPEKWTSIFEFMCNKMIQMEDAYDEIKDYMIHDELGK